MDVVPGGDLGPVDEVDLFHRTVKLTMPECLGAAVIGLLRCFEDTTRGSFGTEGQPVSNLIGANVEGELGAWALAKALDRFPTSRAHKDRLAGDVGKLEVRTTGVRGGSLHVRPKDDPERAYFLVEGAVGHYRVVGWIRGRDAQIETHHLKDGEARPDGLRVRKGAAGFYVPQPSLIRGFLPREVDPEFGQ